MIAQSRSLPEEFVFQTTSQHRMHVTLRVVFSHLFAGSVSLRAKPATKLRVRIGLFCGEALG